MNQAKELKKMASRLGWKFLRRNGPHEIWVSPSGHRMPLPCTPSNNQSVRNIASKLKRYSQVACIIALMALPIPSALGAPQSISAEAAQVETGSVATVKIGLNVGVPVKMPSGWRVYKGWLDNSALAEVDGDRPFEQGASLVYLVGRAAGSGKLSLMVRDRNGADRLFVLRLVVGASGSDLVTIRDSSPAAVSVSEPQLTPVAAIQRGMQSAAQSGRLIRGSELWQAVERFNSLVAQGIPSDAAAAQAGISLNVIQQLIQMSSPAVLPVPSAPAPTPTPRQAPPTPPVSEPALIQAAVPPRSGKRSVPRLPDLNFSRQFLVKADPKPTLDALPEPEIQPAQDILALPSKPQSKPNRPVQVARAYAKKPSPVAGHSLANGIGRGLLSRQNKVARYGSAQYKRFQDVIWLLRKGWTLERACQSAGVSVQTAEVILKYGGVDISALGG